VSTNTSNGSTFSGPSFASSNGQAHKNQQLELYTPYTYVSLALQTLAEYDVEVEDRHRLDISIRMGIRSVESFFTAAHHEPSQDELDLHFQAFILKAVASGRTI
jgi:hypothetical protein